MESWNVNGLNGGGDHVKIDCCHHPWACTILSTIESTLYYVDVFQNERQHIFIPPTIFLQSL